LRELSRGRTPNTGGTGENVITRLSQGLAEALLRSTGRPSQGDFRPAETHGNPDDDQLQHKLARVIAMIRQVIGKFDADTPFFCHDSHF
jgi:hypothetical protein